MRAMAILMAALMAPVLSLAAVQSKTLEYLDGEAVLEAYVASDEAVQGPRPGILVVNWMGISAETRRRCDLLAGLGYVAFAADVYGKGVRPSGSGEAAKLAGKYKADRALLRRRLAAGLSELKKLPGVDPARTAAIGYCFGGTAVLELARSGADLRGVVSFHGGLDAPDPAKSGVLKAKVLALHGADDPFVPPAQVAAFEEEMRKAGADWQLVAYGGAVHSFTNPGAGADPGKGAAYNALADARSWRAMQEFFLEIFGRAQ
jgi:dienelactone hydrolase